MLAAAEALLEESLYAPERLPEALDAAGQMLGFEYFCLVEANLRGPRIVASDRQHEGIASYYAGGWAEVDYRARTEPFSRLGSLYLDHRVIGEEERQGSAVYNEFYRPRNMAHYAGIRFDLDGQEWFCSASRGEHQGVIDGEDAAAFLRIASLAMRTASAAWRIEATRARDLFEGLEISRTAAILLDEQGRVSAVTSAAEAMFTEAFGVREGQLWADVDKDAEVLAQLTQFARARLPELPRRNFLLRGHGATRPIQVSATRVLRSGLDALPRGRLLLMLTPVGIQPRSRKEELCQRFGLTLAEADVASQFVNGRSIPEIAGERGVAESTIREQMKAIYRKTGVTRQVDLFRLLAPFRH